MCKIDFTYIMELDIALRISENYDIQYKNGVLYKIKIF